MAYAIKKKGVYKNVKFSVVNHPQNHELDASINKYIELLTDKSVFSSFKSNDIISAAKEVDDRFLNEWVKWYSELYMIE